MLSAEPLPYAVHKQFFYWKSAGHIVCQNAQRAGTSCASVFCASFADDRTGDGTTTGLSITPKSAAPIQPPVADRLAQVRDPDIPGLLQVGYRPRHPQNAVVGSGG